MYATESGTAMMALRASALRRNENQAAPARLDDGACFRRALALAVVLLAVFLAGCSGRAAHGLF